MFAVKHLGTLSQRLANRFVPACQLGARRGLRAYPNYNVFSDDCMLTFKLLPPAFKCYNDVLSVEGNKRGRLLLEWTPRNADGTLSREKDVVLRFGLSAEEIGLLLYQIPKLQPVEMVRQPAIGETMYDSSSAPHKVCKVVPNPDVASVAWTIDFEVDGVGGQVLQNAQGPLTVETQAGEAQVVMEIMREAIPVLVGWKNLQDIALEKVVDEAKAPGGHG